MTCPYKTPDGNFPSMSFCSRFFECGDCIDNYEMMKDGVGKNGSNTVFEETSENQTADL